MKYIIIIWAFIFGGNQEQVIEPLPIPQEKVIEFIKPKEQIVVVNKEVIKETVKSQEEILAELKAKALIVNAEYERNQTFGTIPSTYKAPTVIYNKPIVVEPIKDTTGLNIKISQFNENLRDFVTSSQLDVNYITVNNNSSKTILKSIEEEKIEGISREQLDKQILRVNESIDTLKNFILTNSNNSAFQVSPTKLNVEKAIELLEDIKKELV